MQDNPSFTYFHRNRQYLAEWIYQIHSYPINAQISNIKSAHIFNSQEQIQMQEITSNNISKYINKYLSTCCNENVSKQKYSSVEHNAGQLWDNNHYYTQCLKDFSEDLMYYSFAKGYGLRRRATLPQCLIGYYEITKNIVYQSFKENNSNSIKQQQRIKQKKPSENINKLKGRSVSKSSVIQNKKHQNQVMKLPKQFGLYSQQNIIRILFMQAPFNYIRLSLIKLQNSVTTQIFCKQLSAFITQRFSKFCVMYSLKFQIQNKNSNSLSKPLSNPLCFYFMHNLLQNANEQNLQMSIDQILLCIVYCVYRKSNYSILFSNIVDLYEKQYEASLDRKILLDFYNQIFIVNLLPIQLVDMIGIIQNVSEFNAEEKYKQIDDSKQMNIKMDDSNKKGYNYMTDSKFSLNLSGLVYEAKKQQKSLFDMFQ